MPLVSIIIPAFNRAHLITETLDSVLSQTYSNWECIIVDDGSEDDIEAVVKRFSDADSRFRFAIRPTTKPKGANSCRNHGLTLANGGIINWVDSDDVLAEEHLSVHIRAHQIVTIDAVVTNAEVFRDSINNRIRDWGAIIPQQNLVLEMCAGKVLWQTNCVSWKRSSLPATPFSEELFSSQEWTFHLSQLINGASYRIISETTCFVRDHDARIGKVTSVKKSFSTFESRRKTMQLLARKKMLDENHEKALLKNIFVALRQSLQFRYYSLATRILRYLAGIFVQSKNKAEIARVLFIAAPLFAATGKGEKFFRLKSSDD